MHRLTLGLLALALVAAGCSSDDSPYVVDLPADTFCQADLDIEPPHDAGELVVDGLTRSYLIDLPASYTGDELHPLILNWHGNGSNAAQQRAYTGLAQVTDAIVVTPEGTGDPQHFSLVPGPRNPDIRFAQAIVTEFVAVYCADPGRIYATGISNGSGLSSELACQKPDLFAAVALVAATIGPLDCRRPARVPVLAFHGTADPVVPYEGGRIGTSGIPVPSAEEGITRWATQNHCDPEPTVEEIGADVVHWTFQDCEADVEAYWIQGGGHVWPGAGQQPVLGHNTETINASALISEWFAEHVRR